jgi:hypothetical protein
MQSKAYSALTGGRVDGPGRRKNLPPHGGTPPPPPPHVVAKPKGKQMPKVTETPLRLDLDQFTGTELYHKVGPRLIITDGVKYLCDKTGCYWLMDVIGSYQFTASRDEMLAGMQFWHLIPAAAAKPPFATKGGILHYQASDEGVSAYVLCERDRKKEGVIDDAAIVQEIPFTDFPFDAVPGRDLKLYAQPQGDGNTVVCLPSEY